MSHKQMSHRHLNQPWENTIKVAGLWCSIIVQTQHNGKAKIYYPAGHYDYAVTLPGCVNETQVVRYIKRIHKI